MRLTCYHGSTERSIRKQGIVLTRPPELNGIMKSLETSRARIPYRLLKQPQHQIIIQDDVSAPLPEDEDDKDIGGGVKTRREVKVQCQKIIRAEQKKSTPHNMVVNL